MALFNSTVSLPSITSGTITNTAFSANTIDTISGLEASYVLIDQDGVSLKPECDIKIGERSLKEIMDKVEERLNILHVNKQLEDRWEQLAELGRQYRELEKELLEKEKMWKILKDSK